MQILADIRLLGRGGVSGIEEYTRNLMRTLLKTDQQNDYSLFYNGFRKFSISPPTPSLPAGQAGLRRAGNFQTKIINWRIPNKLFDMSTRFLGWPAIDKIVKTDLVFSPHFNILKTAKAPRIVTFHDLSFLHHPYFFSRRQRFWHWLQGIKEQARRADKIIAVSEFTKSDLVNLLGVPTEKIQVIYSGIAEEFRAIANNANFLPNNANKPFILCLGTLEPRKNVTAIIRAFNILKADPSFKDWQLVIAGRPGWLFKNILKEAKLSVWRDDIIFRGAVSGDERVLLYNLARVFVYPSFFEGFGFPPLEAQACGCPTVAADRTSLPEILGDSALLVNPWKVEDLAGAIKKAATDERERKRLIKNGLENARRFSWEKTAKQTLELFNQYA
ncbi:MAG: putative glycosyltransferase [Parcubacteria group bacterium GW2011_GWA2_47_8b]|nr:MAG: putative glycosyltransferase [Parcubacteria group bacterium GW2011_GWA2_47_8b]